jgi:hypothetical protein
MQQKKITWLFVLTCFLVPCYFILHNYLDFKGLIDFKKLTTYIILCMTAPAVFIFFYWITTKSLPKATLATSVLLIIHFYAASVINELKAISFLSHFLRYIIIIPLLSIFLLWFHYQLYTSKKSVYRVQVFLALLFFVFFSFELIEVISIKFNWQPPKTFIEPKNRVILNTANTTSDTNKLKPDIFFLIFDEYPSSTSLKDVFAFNNLAHDSALTKLNFKVSSAARSAHFNTPACLYSLLGLAEITPETGEGFSHTERLAITQQLRSTELMPFFEANGYKIMNASMFDFDNHPSVAKNYLFFQAPEDILRNQTFFRRVRSDVGWNFLKFFKERFIKNINQNIANEVTYSKKIEQAIDSSFSLDESQPKFFYGHFFLPHYSYKFDENGNTITWDYQSYEKHFNTQASYLAQVKYANKLMLEIIGKIFANNKRPAIIIIQGDHGNRRFVDKGFPNENKKKILSAIYFPDQQYEEIKDDLFAPNTFRIILNKYFDQKIPLLK